jgi:hypothetical protein
MMPEKTGKSLLSLERSIHKWSKCNTAKLCIDCILSKSCMIREQCGPEKKYWKSKMILENEFRKAHL